MNATLQDFFKRVFITGLASVAIGCGPDQAGGDKLGMIVKACGPADGAVVRVFLTDEMLSCSTTNTDVENINAFIDTPYIEDAGIGMTIESSGLGAGGSGVYACPPGFTGCVMLKSLSLEVEDQQGDILSGTYILNKGYAREQGRFQIKQCVDERRLCG